jgi:hypothetical protein
VVLLGPGENIEALSDRYPQAFTTEILGLYELALLPSLETGLLIRGLFCESTLNQFSVSYPWQVEPTRNFSDDPPKPLLGLLVPNLPSMGLFKFCSRVALEAALDEVGSVLDTRVRLRSWYGIAGRFEWVELELNGWQGDGRGGWQYLGGGLIFVIVGKAQLATPL